MTSVPFISNVPSTDIIMNLALHFNIQTDSIEQDAKFGKFYIRNMKIEQF